MISEIKDIKSKLLDVKYNRIEQGLGLGVAEIDEFLRFKKASFNICVGHANTGKTTVLMYIMTAYALKHNLKWLIFSSENTDYSIARKVIEFKTQKTINELSDAQIDKETEWLNGSFKIINVNKVYTARTLLAEALEIKKTFDYDGLLIDPYNSLAKDPQLLRSVGGHEYDYQISSEMRLFAKQNNVSIWLNAHAVTEALRRTHSVGHEFEGYPKPPSMADVEGGGKWGNRADDVIAVHRYTQHPTKWVISEIHVKKVKETETGGRPTNMDSPISLRMQPKNVSFTVAGKEICKPIIESLKDVETPKEDLLKIAPKSLADLEF